MEWSQAGRLACGRSRRPAAGKDQCAHRATVGAVDEATIKVSIESQLWGDDQGLKITAPHRALSRLSTGHLPEGFSRTLSTLVVPDSTAFQPVVI